MVESVQLMQLICGSANSVLIELVENGIFSPIAKFSPTGKVCIIFFSLTKKVVHIVQAEMTTAPAFSFTFLLKLSSGFNSHYKLQICFSYLKNHNT